jgi:murein DD-endopeptidase MepM/ murein hydrolase activator NlpD
MTEQAKSSGDMSGKSPMAALFLLAVLSGCEQRFYPAPVYYYEAPTGMSVPMAPAPVARPDFAIVQPGDDVNGIAQRYGVSRDALIAINHLQPPYHLVLGQHLTLPRAMANSTNNSNPNPRPNRYRVQPGDTLPGIARRFGVDPSTLAVTNFLKPPYRLRTGDILVLPAPVQTAMLSPRPSAPSPNLPPSSAPAPHRSDVGRPFTLPPAPPAPDIISAPTVRAVPTPRITSAPLPEPVTAKPPPKTATPIPDATANLAAPLPSARVPSVSPPAPPPETHVAMVTPPSPPVRKATPPVETSPPHEAPPREAPAPASGGPSAFSWPVRGTVLSGFGPGANGTQNDGINIAAPLGTPIRAAKDGEVAYVGNELRGYGNLVLLKHPDGWMTAYAHCDALLVKVHDHVRRGQMIARVGKTGAVGEPQLHFELRRGTRPVNPAGHLAPPGAAESD